MTLKNGGVEIDGIVNSILEYIGKEGFQLVALQEFPINHKSGKKFIDEMNSRGFKEFHNNDIINYTSDGTSISIIFVHQNGNHVIRKVLEKNLRYVCLNVNGIDILNVHATFDPTSPCSLEFIKQYRRTNIGLIFGDFNAGLYVKEKSPQNYSNYKEILDNGFTDILASQSKEKITTRFKTYIDHVLDKGVQFKTCTVDSTIKYSDHYPIILEY
jgi:exonuclease III